MAAISLAALLVVMPGIEAITLAAG